MIKLQRRLDFFFFNDTATTEIYTLSLHDALPIYPWSGGRSPTARVPKNRPPPWIDRKSTRLNSSHRCISYAVFCLKKKRTTGGRENVGHTRRARAPGVTEPRDALAPVGRLVRLVQVTAVGTTGRLDFFFFKVRAHRPVLPFSPPRRSSV